MMIHQWKLSHLSRFVTFAAMALSSAVSNAGPPIPRMPAPAPPPPRMIPHAPVRPPMMMQPRMMQPKVTSMQKPIVTTHSASMMQANKGPHMSTHTQFNPNAARANMNALMSGRVNNHAATAQMQTTAAARLAQAQGISGVSRPSTIADNGGVRTGFGPSAANQTALNQGQSLTKNALSPQLQQQLNLSSAQLSQVNHFQNTFNQEMTSLNNRFASDPQGTTSLMTQARQQLQQETNSVLNPTQQQIFSQFNGQAPRLFNSNPAFFGNSNAMAGTNASSNGGYSLGSYGALYALNGGGGSQPSSGMVVASNTGTTAANNTARISMPRSTPMDLAQAGASATGFATITDPRVQKALDLSDQQISQLQQYQLDHAQRLGDLSGRFRTDPQGTTKLYNDALLQSQQRISSVLTPSQRQQWSTITGVPDTLSGENSLP